MASKTFTTGTVIDSAWLNDINTAAYTTLPALAGTVAGLSSAVPTITSINNNFFTAPPTTATWTAGSGKTITISNTLTFVGIDGAVLNVGNGGTLGTGAFINVSGVNTGDQDLTPYSKLAGGNTFTGTQTFSNAMTVSGHALIGTTTDDGVGQLQVAGPVTQSGSSSVLLGGNSLRIYQDTNSAYFDNNTLNLATGSRIQAKYATRIHCDAAVGAITLKLGDSGAAGAVPTFTSVATFNAAGRVLIGTTTDNGTDRLQVNGSGSFGALSATSATVSGNTTTGTFTSTGAASTGALTSSSLTVSGASSFAAGTFTGNVTMTTATYSGLITASAANFSGAVSFASTSSFTGAATFAGAISAAGITASGTATFNGPMVANGVQTVKGQRFAVTGLGNITGTATIDLAIAGTFTATVTGAVAISFNNAPPAGYDQTVYLKLTNGGAYGISWPTGTKFPDGGTAPTFTTAGTDLLAIWYDVESSKYVVGIVWKDFK